MLTPLSKEGNPLGGGDGIIHTGEVLAIDSQADFDPKAVDLSAVEALADKAETAGQVEYAHQIRHLIRCWQKANQQP